MILPPEATANEKTSKRQRRRDEALPDTTPPLTSSMDYDDIDLFDDNVEVGESNGIPFINFSDRVQNLAINSMDLTILVKILGRRIGYNTLYNGYSPCGNLATLSSCSTLENNHFLVKFSARLDYLSALTDGPWVIFGHYLTVEPCSIDFDPSQSHPSRIIAWVRLPGIPITWYKRSLIQAISEKLGSIIKIHYQTNNGRRGHFARMAVTLNLNKLIISNLEINGRIQFVEHEGIPLVCFNCGIYGHFNDFCPNRASEVSQVDNQHMHHCPQPPLLFHKNPMVIGCFLRKSSVETDPNPVAPILQLDTATQVATPPSIANQNTCAPPSKPHPQTFDHHHWYSKPQLCRPFPLALSHSRQGQPPQLDSSSHNAVSIAPDDTPKVLASATTFPSVMEPHFLVPLHGDLARPSKPPDPPHQQIAALSHLGPPAVPTIVSQNGYESMNFLRVMRQYLHDNNSDICVLVETRISRANTEIVINGWNFPNSFRIEAGGYADCIWLCWYDTIHIDISSYHFQFLHCHVTDKRRYGRSSFLAIFVYASPNASKQKYCWFYMRTLIDFVTKPWILVGDFNATLSIEDRSGYASSSTLEASFQDLVFDCGLHDLGHHGPRFTWFNGYYSDCWDSSLPISEAIVKFSKAVADWNKNIFGVIGKNKRILMARLRGVQHCMGLRRSRNLLNLESKLLQELEVILDQEEQLWIQKSRTAVIGVIRAVFDRPSGNSQFHSESVVFYGSPFKINSLPIMYAALASSLLIHRVLFVAVSRKLSCTSSMTAREFTTSGVICLNTDDVYPTSTGRGSIDGLLRNSSGDCLLAFCRDIGISLILETELWAILDGLQAAWHYGCDRLVVQTDSMDVYHLLSPPASTSPFTLVCAIVSLYNRAWYVEFQVEFQKINREANAAAHYIAKMGTSPYGSRITFVQPSAPLEVLLHRDVSGPPYVRLTR
ncbi:hypothetical protein F3Y22_tig00110831pilonHSYRG00755 [Hibiscus syriacus]|uniref:CCHC-type domain-containing protein n=1 Tax=Hibiscus syriacus TaxID=106335 RepID=A0A6A2ZN89_HIBSY|nr:hypothetical protein F3Y22_tig00110831pilonHSYRG00755 [Hibiscus syriacus]